MSQLMPLMKRVSFLLAYLTSLSLPAIASANDVLDLAIEQSQQLEPARLIRRNEFLDRHAITSIRISPDGQKLAFITPSGKNSSLWIQDIASGENRLLFTSEIVDSIYWSTDGSHIIMATRSGVAATSIDKNSFPQFLIRLEPEVGEMFYGVDPESPRHIFVTKYNKGEEDFSLYRVDMAGQKTLLYRGKDKLHDFVAEREGPIKFVMQAENLSQTLYQIEGDKRRALLTCDYDEGCGIARYHAASNSLYLYSRHGGDIQHLVRMDIATKEISTVHKDPEGKFDIDDVYFSAKTGLPVLVEYDTDFRSSYGLDTDTEQHVFRIKKALQSEVIHIKPMADTNWLIINSDPKSAYHRFYIYNLQARRLSEPLRNFIKENPVKQTHIADSDLSLKAAFWYPASDGFKLQAYVTLPRGVKISEAPMVVVPHGGPWSRTYGSFSSIGQLLANRGYIVFAPNFRASTGFGRTYVNAANKDFGDGRVQDDIIDGVTYLLNRGIGHQDKLAIFGHSFGGFSTMAALAFTPEMFQVGIAGAPPPSLSKAVRYYVKRQDKTGVGILRKDVMTRLAVDIDDPDDVKRLYNQSPDKHYDKVTKPIYIVAGEKDQRVNILDVRDYAVRLEANGVPIGMMTDKREGHNFKKTVAKEAYFYLVEKVLAHHLGGRFEPVVSKKLEKYLKKNMVIGELP